MTPEETERLAARFDVLAALAINAAGDIRAGCLTPAQTVELAGTLEDLGQDLLLELPTPPPEPRRGFSSSGP